MRISKIFTSFVAAAAIALGASAKADTIQSWLGPVVPTTERVTFTLAGFGTVSGTNSQSTFRTATGYVFDGFCIEAEQNSKFPSIYVQSPMSESDKRTAELGRLYTGFYDAARANSTSMTAFAAAIWEIWYDGQGSLNTNAGKFSVATEAKVGAQLNSMLALAGNTAASVGSWDFITWKSDTSQDFLEVRPHPAQVPVPASFALLVAGLFGFGIRRKSSK